MKALEATPRKVVAANAWGRNDTTFRQTFEVESSDVGTTKSNYLGQGQPGYTFRGSDVGRVIEVITAPNYMCWAFNTMSTPTGKRWATSL